MYVIVVCELILCVKSVKQVETVLDTLKVVKPVSSQVATKWNELFMYAAREVKVDI